MKNEPQHLFLTSAAASFLMLSYHLTGFDLGPGTVVFCAFDGLISSDPDIVSASFACVAKGGRGRFFTNICSFTVVKILIFSVLELITGDLAVFFPLDDDLSGVDVFQTAQDFSFRLDDIGLFHSSGVVADTLDRRSGGSGVNVVFVGHLIIFAAVEAAVVFKTRLSGLSGLGTFVISERKPAALQSPSGDRKSGGS